MNKFIHLLIWGVFSIACTCVWGLLTLSAGGIGGPRTLPGFTQICVSLRPVLFILPVLAAIYCVWILSRKADKPPSWVDFFAGTISLLVLVTLPLLVAAYCSVIAAVNSLPAR